MGEGHFTFTRLRARTLSLTHSLCPCHPNLDTCFLFVCMFIRSMFGFTVLRLCSTLFKPLSHVGTMITFSFLTNNFCFLWSYCLVFYHLIWFAFGLVFFGFISHTTRTLPQVGKKISSQYVQTHFKSEFHLEEIFPRVLWLLQPDWVPSRPAV